jgi:hypothetical protein
MSVWFDINELRSIMGCVMFGRERDQAGVLIELKAPYVIDPSNEQDVISIRNNLWFVDFSSSSSDMPLILPFF